jgi:hypothetical protein
LSIREASICSHAQSRRSKAQHPMAGVLTGLHVISPTGS